MKCTKHTTQGFTLIELLIAGSIFALVMVSAISTFSWTTSFNSKLREMRRVSSEGRYAIAEISKEARMANGSATLTGGTKVAEMQAVNCNLTSVSNYNCASASSPANGVLILNKDNNYATVFFSKTQGLNSRTYRVRFPYNASFAIKKADCGDAQLINTEASEELTFTTFAPLKDVRLAQPYVDIKVTVRTWDYDANSPRFNYTYDFSTSVESRDYNLL